MTIDLRHERSQFITNSNLAAVAKHSPLQPEKTAEIVAFASTVEFLLVLYSANRSIRSTLAELVSVTVLVSVKSRVSMAAV